MKISVMMLSFFLLTIVGANSWAGYSAIAYNSSTQEAGEAHGYATADEATNAAINVCGAGCVWLAWSQNSCVALATNPSGDYGYSWGQANANVATNAAINACNGRGTGGCGWLVWACN